MKFKLSKFLFEGKARIGISFGYNPKYIEMVKQIPGARWNQELKVWHIPDTSRAIGRFKEIFRHNINSDQNKNPSGELVSNPFVSKIPVHVEVSNKKIKVKTNQNREYEHFLRKFMFSRKDYKTGQWILPSYGNNLELIMDHFGDRIINIVYVDSPAKEKKFRIS